MIYRDSFNYYWAKYNVATKAMLRDSLTGKHESQEFKDFERYYKLMMNADDSSQKYFDLYRRQLNQ